MSSTSCGVTRIVAAAETREIRQPGMRANRDARLARQPDGPPHDRRVARVKAAGDIRGRDARHQLGIRANGEGAERLAQVAVQVDMAHSSFSSALQHRTVSGYGLTMLLRRR